MFIAYKRLGWLALTTVQNLQLTKLHIDELKAHTSLSVKNSDGIVYLVPLFCPVTIY